MKRLITMSWWALYRIVSAPKYLFIVVVTIGGAMGALASVFGLNLLLLAKPLPYDGADQYAVTRHYNLTYNANKRPQGNVVPAELITKRISSPILESVMMAFSIRERLKVGAQSFSASVLKSTPEFLDLFTPEMTLGSFFGTEGVYGSGQLPVVLSFSTWANRFDRDPDIVGRTVTLGQRRGVIIGVISEHFPEPQLFGHVHQVFTRLPADEFDDNTLNDWFSAKANLMSVIKVAKGYDLAAAQDVINENVTQGVRQVIPEQTQAKDHVQVELQPLREHIQENGLYQSLALLMSMSLLAIIACLNIGNLVIVKAIQNKKSNSIKLALGATKTKLVMVSFGEHITVIGVCGLVALSVTQWGFVFLKRFGQGHFNRLGELELDVYVAGFIVFLVVTIAGIFSVLSVLPLKSNSIARNIKHANKGGELAFWSASSRLMMTVQIAFCSILLGLSLMVFSHAWDRVHRQTGVVLDNIYSVVVDVQSGFQSEEVLKKREGVYSQILDDVRELDTVSEASLSFGPPLVTHMKMNSEFNRHPILNGSYPVNFVDNQFFSITGIRLIAGTFFDENLREGQVIISQGAIGEHEDLQDYIGTQVAVGGREPQTIVGIVSNASGPLRNSSDLHKDIYLPYRPWNFHLLVQTQEGETLNQSSIEKLLASYGLEVLHQTSLAGMSGEAASRYQIQSNISLCLAIAAILLVASGVSTSVTYSLKAFSKDIAIKRALGARTSDVWWIITKRYGNSLVIGCLISLLVFALMLSAVPFMETKNMELNAYVFLLSLPLIGSICAVSLYWPVKKVVASAPARVLRNDYE